MNINELFEQYSEEYLLEHKDEFETMEYGNIREVDFNLSFYVAIFNGNFSHKDTEANSKEGWIKVFVTNKEDKGNFCCYTPYLVKYNEEIVPAEVKLFGDVVIFKLDSYGKLIEKKG